MKIVFRKCALLAFFAFAFWAAERMFPAVKQYMSNPVTTHGEFIAWMVVIIVAMPRERECKFDPYPEATKSMRAGMWRGVK